MSKLRKPKKSKSQKISHNPNIAKYWENLIKGAAKDNVPLELMHCIRVHLIGGASFDIDINEMVSRGYDHHDIELSISDQLASVDDITVDIVTIIDGGLIQKMVAPHTAKLLERITK